MVVRSNRQVAAPSPMVRRLKKTLSRIVSLFLRLTFVPWNKWKRLYYHAYLSSRLQAPLDASAVVLGKATVFGTGKIRLGRNILLYPNLYLETQGEGSIEVGDSVVFSSGVHLVSMSGISIGEGSMIGEYSSVRDSGHARLPGVAIRESGYTSSPIRIGREVWIGRGVTVLAGVTIGDGATVGANAVVTRDVPAGVTVAGVPARPLGAGMPAELPLRRTPGNIHEPLAETFGFVYGENETTSCEIE